MTDETSTPEPRPGFGHYLGKGALWFFTIVLGLGFVAGGWGKFGYPWPDMFARWGYPDWFRMVIGIVEMAGGVALLVPRLSPFGAAALAVVMVGATGTHLVHGESNWSFTFILVTIFVALAFFHSRRLRASSSG